MKEKLVSVNITTCNRAHLLPRCIDSVTAQSYQNLEIVVVDDGSADNTGEIMAGYLQKDKRIKYFRHETNKGNACARNTALKNCTGYYVAFMDDDDEWIDPNKIKKQVEIFENDTSGRLGIVCSNLKLVDSEGNIRIKRVQKPDNWTSHLLRQNMIIYSPTVMTKREIMREIGGFDERFPKRVDWEFFNMCIIKRKYDVYFMDEVTTACSEFGEDRLTTTLSLAGIKRIVNADYYMLIKYFPYYLKYPGALCFRFRSLLASIVRYVMVKWGFRRVDQRSFVGKLLGRLKKCFSDT